MQDVKLQESLPESDTAELKMLRGKLRQAQGLVRLYRACLGGAGVVIVMLAALLLFAKAPQLGRAILIDDQVVVMVRGEKAAMEVRQRLLASAQGGGPGQATFREKWEDVTRPVEGGRVVSVSEAIKALQPKVTVVKEAFAIENNGVRLVVVPTKETALNVLDRLKVRYSAATDAVVRETKLRPEPTIRPCTAVPSHIVSDEEEAAGKLATARTQPEVYKVRKGDYPAKIAGSYGLSLAELWQLNPGLSGKQLKVGQPVNVLSRAEGLTVVVVKECVTTEPVAPPVKETTSANLPKGERKMVKPGKPGQKRVRWEVVTHNGREVRRKSLSEETLTKAEAKEVVVGAKAEE